MSGVAVAGRDHAVRPGDRADPCVRGPARLVFDALTGPELLVRWYGARGWNLVECEVDLRVGGAWRFVSRGPDDAHDGPARTSTARSCRRNGSCLTETVRRPVVPGETLITHVFAERHGTTTVTSTVLYRVAGGPRHRASGIPWRAACPRLRAARRVLPGCSRSTEEGSDGS